MSKSIFTITCCLIFLCPEMLFGQNIKIMTYNIRYDNPNDGIHVWENRRDKIISQIRYYQPDFLGLQEVVHTQNSFLKEKLRNYTVLGVGRDDGKEAGEYAPIYFNNARFELIDWGTFWLSETPDRPSKGWDAALPRIATWAMLREIESGKVWNVINTHFDHVGIEARLQSLKLIYSYAMENMAGGRIVMMGDFNIGPSSEAYIWLKNQDGLLDSFLSAPIVHGPEGTFNAFKHDYLGERIDYVWLSRDLRAISYASISEIWKGIIPSDHWPVLVEIIEN